MQYNGWSSKNKTLLIALSVWYNKYIYFHVKMGHNFVYYLMSYIINKCFTLDVFSAVKAIYIF